MDFMKTFSIILAFVILLTGCSGTLENYPDGFVSSESSSPEAQSSGYENPYSDCVPEWSISSPDPDSSLSHSSDSSSNIEPAENKFIPKTKVGSEYYYIAETLATLSESRLGTAEELERWKAEISDMENVHELVIDFVECEDRYVSVEEAAYFIDELQSQSPKIFEQPENPATGGAYYVAAHGQHGEIRWIFVYGGFYTVYLPEYGVPLDFDPADTYFASLSEICSYRSPMTHP